MALFQYSSIKFRQIVDVEFEIQFEIHSNKESAKRSEINMENIGNVENIGVEGFDNFKQWLIHGLQWLIHGLKWLILGLTGLFFLITFGLSILIANAYGIGGFQVIEIGIQIYVMRVIPLFLGLFLIFKILRIIVL